MALRTVRVPVEMEPLFERAEQVVSAYFQERVDRPEFGTIEIFGERYVLVRAAALSVEFFQTVRDLLGPDRESEADDFARTILFDLAHAVGRSDARNFHQKMHLEDPIARMSAGPVHFAHAGWAFVDILPESVVGDESEYHLVYDHPYSFESDAWLRAGRRSAEPVCVMNAGYSSGWCEESFGIELVSTELMCRARGDDCCRFVMAPPARLEASVARYDAEHADRHSTIAPVIPEIFARKRLEDDLKAARAELERRVEERTLELRRANERVLREMTERATIERMLVQSQKMEALGQLAGGIAHDFNNLLTAIGGYAELLLDQVPGHDPRRRYAVEIVNNTQRAARLTQQLLVFSRQEVFTPTVVDVPTVVEGLAVLLRRLIGEDVRVQVTCETGPLAVRMDRNQLETVLINLVVNARDAMWPRGGQLDIEVDAPDDLTVDLVDPPRDLDLVRVQVRDTGCGMDPDTLSRAFEPFFTTKELGQGTGLGLATVYGIVQAAGGQIHAQSAVGQGTTMTLLFPRVHATPDAAKRSDDHDTTALQGLNVLVVEDEVVVREFVAQVLARRGCRVLAASDADQAKALFAQAAHHIDVVVCDVILPGGSGPALVDVFRAARPELSVLYVSGYTGDRIDPDQLRGASFLQKPFTVGQLLQAVERALGTR